MTDKDRNSSPQSQGVLEPVDAIEIHISSTVCCWAPRTRDVHCWWDGPQNDQWMSNSEPISLWVFLSPKAGILCHILSFRCWMQPSSSQWCRKWSGCPWHFLSSQKWSESSLDVAGACNWTSILFQKYMRLAFFYPILHCVLNRKKDLFITSIWKCILRNDDNAD